MKDESRDGNFSSFLHLWLIRVLWKNAEMFFAMIRKGLKCWLMSLKPQIKACLLLSQENWLKLMFCSKWWNKQYQYGNKLLSMYLWQPIEIYRQSIQYFIQMRMRLRRNFLLCELPFTLNAHTHTKWEGVPFFK